MSLSRQGSRLLGSRKPSLCFVGIPSAGRWPWCSGLLWTSLAFPIISFMPGRHSCQKSAISEAVLRALSAQGKPPRCTWIFDSVPGRWMTERRSPHSRCRRSRTSSRILCRRGTSAAKCRLVSTEFKSGRLLQSALAGLEDLHTSTAKGRSYSNTG